MLCQINDFFYVFNDVANESYLWKDGLHLTNEGSSLFLDSFLNYVIGDRDNSIWLMTKGCDIDKNIGIKENPLQLAKKGVRSPKSCFHI